MLANSDKALATTGGAARKSALRLGQGLAQLSGHVGRELQRLPSTPRSTAASVRTSATGTPKLDDLRARTGIDTARARVSGLPTARSGLLKH